MRLSRAVRLLSCLQLLSLVSGAATATDAPVLPASVLTQVRAVSAGEVHVVAWAEGPLQGDVPVIAVLFSVVPGQERDPSHAQFLVVLPVAGYQEVARQLPSNVSRVGGAEQHFSSLAISERRISLSGNRYAPDDPRCCPSQPVTLSYRLDGPWLTAVAADSQDRQPGAALQRAAGGT